MTDGERSKPDRTVRETYDEIASHFSTKREHPWPDVEEFLDGESVHTALDLGCGNGRHTELLADVAAHAIGVDVSRGLLEEAVQRRTERGFEASLIQGDAARLPLADDSVELLTYIATLHHLTPRRTRIDSLDEVARILKPGARGIISVWSVEHDRFEETTGFDTTVTFTMPDGREIPRYYHIYDPEEFAAELRESRLAVERQWIAAGNCYAVVVGSETT